MDDAPSVPLPLLLRQLSDAAREGVITQHAKVRVKDLMADGFDPHARALEETRISMRDVLLRIHSATRAGTISEEQGAALKDMLLGGGEAAAEAAARADAVLVEAELTTGRELDDMDAEMSALLTGSGAAVGGAAAAAAVSEADNAAARQEELDAMAEIFGEDFVRMDECSVCVRVRPHALVELLARTKDQRSADLASNNYVLLLICMLDGYPLLGQLFVELDTRSVLSRERSFVLEQELLQEAARRVGAPCMFDLAQLALDRLDAALSVPLGMGPERVHCRAAAFEMFDPDAPPEEEEEEEEEGVRAREAREVEADMFVAVAPRAAAPAAPAGAEARGAAAERLVARAHARHPIIAAAVGEASGEMARAGVRRMTREQAGSAVQALCSSSMSHGQQRQLLQATSWAAEARQLCLGFRQLLRNSDPARLVGTPVDIVRLFQPHVRVLHVENVVRQPLAERFVGAALYLRRRPERAFHGSNAANMPSIVARGLVVPGTDSGVRIAHGNSLGRGVYTSLHLLVSLGYCTSSNGETTGARILVVAILRGTDCPQVLTTDYSEIVLPRAELVLPCYVVHFVPRDCFDSSVPDLQVSTAGTLLDTRTLDPRAIAEAQAARFLAQQRMAELSARKNAEFYFGQRFKTTTIERAPASDDDDDDPFRPDVAVAHFSADAGDYQHLRDGGPEEAHAWNWR